MLFSVVLMALLYVFVLLLFAEISAHRKCSAGSAVEAECSHSSLLTPEPAGEQRILSEASRASLRLAKGLSGCNCCLLL